MCCFETSSLTNNTDCDVRIILPTAFRLELLRKYIPSKDSTFDSTNVIIATQVAMHYSLWAATLPCMRAFLKTFDSGLGATTGLETGIGSNYAKGSKSGYGLRSKDSGYALKSVDSATSAKKTRTAATASFRPDQASTVTTTITAAPNGSRKSIESDSSKKAIITRTQEYEIRHEDCRDS